MDIITSLTFSRFFAYLIQTNEPTGIEIFCTDYPDLYDDWNPVAVWKVKTLKSNI